MTNKFSTRCVRCDRRSSPSWSLWCRECKRRVATMSVENYVRFRMWERPIGLKSKISNLK